MARAAGTGVRVIAGSRRGRRLVVPTGDGVRPTKDIVREAMFSALDSRAMIADAVVLDLYAGSGALAIESLSRGAARAVLVEHDRSALDAISRNLDQLDLQPQARVARSSVVNFLAAPAPDEAPFGLVFADPPYETSDDTVAALIGSLTAPGWLAAGALIAVERPARAQTRPPEGFQACWERTFGDTLVVFVDAFDPSG
ncbi:MAG: 16S rRNA (guanine(966)-N(2))-methyltransferase RsmD [Acidimicrobiia bacterium]